MKKIFRKIVVLLALGGLVFSSCKISTDSSGKSSKKYASLSGKAVFVNAEDSSSIYVTLDKTDGLRTADVLSSQGLSSKECYSVSENNTSNSRKIVAYANCLKDGSFKFENLEAGIYTVYATAPDSQERAVFRNITIDEEEEKIILEKLKLTATGTLSGKITLDSSESNNSGFTVYIGGTSYMAKTGLSGDFTITGIPAGKDYELFIEYGTYTYYWKNADVSAFQNYELGTINLSTDEIKSSSLFKDGKNGTDGKDGTPIIWKGSFESEDEIANPQNLWAYYNTSDGCSYIYDGNSWNLLASKGDNAQSEGLKTYSITYELNGGSFTSTPDFVHLYGKTTQLPTPVKTGYHFSGWYTNEDFSGKKITSLSADFNSNIKLYAYWKSGPSVPGGVAGLNSFLKSLNSKETNTIIITEDFPDLSVIVSALKNNSTEKVVLDLSCTSIEFVFDSEFKDVTNLIGIELPESVTSIGNYAFSNCDGLTSVTIPPSVTSIGREVFSNCDGLTSVTISSGVTSIGNYAFRNCSGLTSVTIPSSVTSIGDGAFSGCDGLTSVTIPSSVTSIGYCAFENCSGLTTVTIPSSVTSIGGHAFCNCDGLTSVTISSGDTSIGDGAFSYCYRLEEVNITDLEAWCKISFSDSTSNPLYYVKHLYLNDEEITSLEIPNTVTSIGNYAFSNCDGLTSVTIPSSVTSIGNCAFSNCDGLTSVTIPSSVTSIGSDAFNNCYGLESVTISSGVTSIGDGAFCNCDGLTSVTIPSSVTSIGYCAFSGCDGLTSVTISSGVTSIGSRAFYGCSGLESVTIPSSVTSIGSDAFYNCYGLVSVTISSGDTYIGDGAFSYCYRFQEVNITDLEAWCKISFSDSTSNPFYYAKHLYLNDVEITSLEIPNTVTSIGNYAFYNCYGLTSVTIPSSVTSIGTYAFDGCSGLTSVTIPSSVTSIGDCAFRSCSGLTSVTIPSSVTSIGDCAFYNCSGIAQITVDKNNPKYDSRDDCNGIIETSTNTLVLGCKNTTIPSSVTSIGEGAFRDCSGLTSVTIPSSVTSIAPYAFYNCTKLRTITFEETTTWYRTTSFSDWENKTGGFQMNVPAATANATNFSSDYRFYEYYWYKL